MTVAAGIRIVTRRGGMLVDPAALDREPDASAESLFDPDYWRDRGGLRSTDLGRGSSWFISTGTASWVLRHYRRGGALAARLLKDRYLWTGEARVRAFAEWRLLALMTARLLPVPQPIAARYRREGLSYRCDLLMGCIPDAMPVSRRLAGGVLAPDLWSAVGATIARFHAAGVCHADLNAHNILVDRRGTVSFIDFDRGRIRARGAWQQANLRRLRRSLLKISAGLPAGRFTAGNWAELLAGYVRAPPPSQAAPTGHAPRL